MLTSERIFQFGEQFCYCTGDFAGQRFKFMEWQKEVVRGIYDPVDDHGSRLITEAWLEICRKSGKTQFAAVLVLYHLVFEKHKEIYSCASSRNQAATLFKMAKETVLASPSLKKLLTIQRNTIENKKANNKYEVLSSDSDRQHGKNPAIVFFDEMHSIKDGGKLYGAMKTGMMAREQPLLITITSAGNDRSTHCYEMHKMALELLAGSKVNPTMFVRIYGLEEGEDWEKEENWYKANPSLGKTTKIEAYRKAYHSATLNRTDQAAFRNFNLNQWVAGDVKWITEDQWAELGTDVSLDDFTGQECVAGLDLATINDLPAFVMVFRRKEKFFAFCVAWISADSLDKRIKNEHVGFREWVDRGWIRVHPGPLVNLVKVRQEIVEMSERFKILELNIDPNRFATEISQALVDAGINVVQHRQALRDFTGPTETLEKHIIQKSVTHDRNGFLSWCFGNVVMLVNSTGDKKPDKGKSGDRIDGLVALIMAFGRAEKLLSDVQEEADTSFEALLKLASTTRF